VRNVINLGLTNVLSLVPNAHQLYYSQSMSIQSYQWSKAESEKQAWEISKELGVPMVSLCPSFVFGPPFSKEMTSSFSTELVGKWIQGQSEVQSRLFVDIRDLAKAHVAAGTLPEAVGKR
jgi:cinnamoyl-CoA reductase